MSTGKRFLAQLLICKHREYFWLVLLFTCNINFDKEFRYLVFWYIYTCFYVGVGKYVCCKYFDILTNSCIN